MPKAGEEASGRAQWDKSAAASSAEYSVGVVNSKASGLPKHNGELDRTTGRPEYTSRGAGPVDSRSRSRERKEKSAPAAETKTPEPQATPPKQTLTAEQMAVDAVHDQQRFWLRVLAESTNGLEVDVEKLREKFTARNREQELVPRVRIKLRS